MKNKTTAIKANFSTKVSETKLVLKNLEHLVEASSLLVVTGYTLKQAFEMSHGVLFYVLVIAGAVVALRGAHEFLKHLANK